MTKGYETIKERFLTFPAETQVLHLVAELARAKDRLPVSKKEAESRLDDSIVLINDILEDPKWVSGRKEVLLLREAVSSHSGFRKPCGTISQIIEATLLLNPGAYRKAQAMIENYSDR